jgi:hypothetical protein
VSMHNIPLRRGRAARFAPIVLALLTSCGGPSAAVAPTAPAVAQPIPGALLDVTGALAASDARVGLSHADRYDVLVQAGDRLYVEVTSADFDPMLELTAPGGGHLVNDDWNGDRQRSRLELVASVAGTLKVQVSSFAPTATGAYRVVVLRAAPAVAVQPSAGAVAAATPQGTFLAPGQSAEGALEAGDGAASDGAFFETIVVNSPRPDPITVTVSSPSQDPLRVLVTNARGQAVAQQANGVFVLPGAQMHRVQLIAPAPGRAARWSVAVAEAPQGEGAPTISEASTASHRTPPSPQTVPVSVGQRVRGELARNDQTLPSSEFADVYALDAPAGASYAIDLASDAFDAYLVVVGPNGHRVENDDSGGTRNASLELATQVAGRYLVFATSFRPGELGAYELKVLPAQRASGMVATRPTSAGGAQPAAAGATQTLSGTLAAGDAQLRTGEFSDVHTVELTAGTTVRVRLASTDFDPYLIVQPPSGAQADNDDVGADDRTAGLDYAVTQTGPHRITATSYRPGETGAYRLTIAGASGPAAGGAAPAVAGVSGPTFRTVRGSLAQGDRALPTGGLFDEEVVTLPAGATVQLQMHSSAFDTVLVVRTPSGREETNDDVAQGNTNSALTLQASEAGEYHILATSYRPGDTGDYELVIGAPAETPAPNTGTVATTPSTTPAAQPVAASLSAPIRGSLARGDRNLASGEFVDAHTVTLPQGVGVQIRLSSTDFDPYLIVRSPSGRQVDNDDLTPGDRNAGIDLPLAEPGPYTIQVTSYRPAETGAYTLSFARGTSIPGAGPAPAAVAGEAPQQGGRVFGIFAGITDYPGGVSDLPECANDARKMSETLTQGGLVDASTQVVLTDGQATVGAVRGALQRFAQQMGPDDVFVFFYSGHGNRRDGSSDGREIDGRDESIVLYDGEILDDEMGTLFDGIRARTSILALDSCFAGGFAKDVITRPGRVGLFSSEEDVTSGVAQQFEAGGYLSHFIRHAMQGAADNDPQDRVLTVGELTHYLHTQFGQHVTDVRMGSAYQQLVVDRGAVSSETVLWAYRR